ncbi:MFS transporter [archaeon]|nr:MAG: MFS transporter [archaeon]
MTLQRGWTKLSALTGGVRTRGLYFVCPCPLCAHAAPRYVRTSCIRVSRLYTSVTGGMGGEGSGVLSSADADTAYRTYPRRWAILAVFCCLTALSAFMWICFSPIFATAQTRYAASTLDINSISMVYMIVYLPGSILAVWLMDQYGLRVNLMVAALLNAACAVVRYGGNMIEAPRVAYGFVLGGQIIASVAQPLILNMPVRVATDWFGPRERDIATTVMTMANAVGNAGGSIVPPFIVNKPDDIQWLLLVQAIPCVVILVVAHFVLVDRPPTPPSVAAAIQWRFVEEEVQHAIDASLAHPAAQAAAAASGVAASPTPNSTHGARAHAVPNPLTSALSPSVHGASDWGSAPSLSPTDGAHVVARANPWYATLQVMLADLSPLMRNRNFVLIMGSFSIMLGMSWAVLTVLAQMVQPCGYDDTVPGTAGAALLGTGVVAALLLGPIMQRSKKYLLLQKLFIFYALGVTVFIMGVNAPGNAALVIGAYCVYGTGVLPLIPVTLEHAAELTYPVAGDNSTAVLLVVANVLGMIFTFVLTPLLEMPVSANCTSRVSPASGLIIGVSILAALLVLPVTKDYRRMAAEQKAADGAHANAAACVRGGGGGELVMSVNVLHAANAVPPPSSSATRGGPALPASPLEVALLH